MRERKRARERKKERAKERESYGDRGGPQYLYKPLGGAGAWLREGKSERMREEKEREIKGWVDPFRSFIPVLPRQCIYTQKVFGSKS